MNLLPVAEALDRLLAAAVPSERTEIVTLHEGAGRVLAEDVRARLTQPPFDNSAMDGYALRHSDIEKLGSVLAVVGTSSAGHAFEGTVEPGQAVRIFTGAPLPAGADTVLLQEDAERLDEHRVRTTFVPLRGRHIRPRGQDFAEGEVVLHRGDLLDAGRLTVAAAMNHPELTVYARPRIVLIATGDELVSPGTPPGPSQIVASNGFGVAALGKAAGAEIIDLGIVKDDPDALRAVIEAAAATAPDVIVTLGGASVGDHDLVQGVMREAGMQLDFWRIAMRPGKPLMVGKLGKSQVLGLPGNPVSSLVCGLLFLEPLVHRLARTPARNRLRTLVTATALAENDRRQDYLRARIIRSQDGTLAASAFGQQDSSMMKVFAASDCLIVRPPHAPALEAGAECDVIMLREPA